MFKVGFDALIGVPADLPEHQSDQDRHGAGPDCCPLQPGQPLREPLRRSQPGTFIQYMELGQTVVCCNLENFYESLYEALNQVLSYSTRYISSLCEISSKGARISRFFFIIPYPV